MPGCSFWPTSSLQGMSRGHSWALRWKGSPEGVRNLNLPIAKVTCARPFFWTFVEAHRGMYQFVGVEGHHLNKMRTTDVPRKASDLDRQGYCTPARCTWRGGTAGCAAVMSDESHIVTALDAFPGQACVMPAELPCAALAPAVLFFVPVAAALIVVYFSDGEELGSRDAKKGADLAVMVRQMSIPWYIAGDCNLSPGVSTGSAWTRYAGRVVETPLCATHSSTAGTWKMIAFAVTRPDLAPMVHGIDMVRDVPWKPHAEMHLIVRAPAEDIPARRLKASVRPEQPALPQGERSSSIVPQPHYTWRAWYREAVEAMLRAGKSIAQWALSYLANAGEAARMGQRYGVLVGANEQYPTGPFGGEGATSDEWLHRTPSNRPCCYIHWPLRARQAVVQEEGWLTPLPYLGTHHYGRQWSFPDMYIESPAPLQCWSWQVRQNQGRRASHQWLAEGSENGACVESVKRVMRAFWRSGKPREGQLALCIARGGMWTEARSVAAGQSQEDRCQHCGGLDNHLHTVWRGCPSVRAVGLPEVESIRDLEATAMGKLHRPPCLWLKALTPQHLMPDIPESPTHAVLWAYGSIADTGLTVGGAFHCTGLTFYIHESDGDPARGVAVMLGTGFSALGTSCYFGVLVYDLRHMADCRLRFELAQEFAGSKGAQIVPRHGSGYVSSHMSVFVSTPKPAARAVEGVAVSTKVRIMQVAGYMFPGVVRVSNLTIVPKGTRWSPWTAPVRCAQQSPCPFPLLCTLPVVYTYWGNGSGQICIHLRCTGFGKQANTVAALVSAMEKRAAQLGLYILTAFSYIAPSIFGESPFFNAAWRFCYMGVSAISYDDLFGRISLWFCGAPASPAPLILNGSHDGAPVHVRPRDLHGHPLHFGKLREAPVRGGAIGAHLEGFALVPGADLLHQMRSYRKDHTFAVTTGRMRKHCFFGNLP